MKTVNIIFFLAVINSAIFARQAVPDKQKQMPATAVISAALKPDSQIELNFFDGYYQHIGFRNNGKKDTIITKTMALSRPLLLAYNNMLMMPAGPRLSSYPILLVPGDTVSIRPGKDGAIELIPGPGVKSFANQLIDFQKNYNWYEDEDVLYFKKEGLRATIQKIDDRYRTNEQKIGNIRDAKTDVNALRNLNVTIKYTSIAGLLLDRQLVPSVITDSLYQDLYYHIGEINAINTTKNMVVCEAVIRYNATNRLPKPKHDEPLSWIIAADHTLKQTDTYKNYLTSLLITTFTNTPGDLNKISQTFKTLKDEVPAADTLYQVTDILKETYTDFAAARKKLKAYAGGRYSFIIENDEKAANHEMKTVNNLRSVTLTDFSGKKHDFKTIVTAKEKYKLTVVDFWASWCIPCIAEIPSMKKMALKFKNKPVRFMAVSIDEDKQVDKWVQAAKRQGIFNQPFQYRLVNFKNSALTSLINLKVIPRYVVLDNTGNILSDDFLRPSHAQFELELMKLLNH